MLLSIGLDRNGGFTALDACGGRGVGVGEGD